MASEEYLKKQAIKAEQEGRYSDAHTMYAMCAERCRRVGDRIKARFFNIRAGVYADFCENGETAAGYIDDDGEQ